MSSPKQIIFFIDRALESKTVLEALRLNGVNLELHSRHFKPDALDTEWLPVVSQRGWFVLTKDARIGRNPQEIRAIASESAGVFILWDGNLRSQEIALLLVEVVHKLEKLALMHQTPFIMKIYRDRSVKVWKSRKQLLKILK